MQIHDDFPKHYDPKIIEPKWQKFWDDRRDTAYDEKSSKPVFSIDTPPPTVSGKLHIGHVFSYTQTEVTSRFRRMKGFNVFYPFGYDDNGLPTELLTEKEIGKRAHQMERSEFRRLCRETGKKYSSLFSHLWKSLGFSCDFESAYSTISPTSQKISQWAFVDLYHKNRLERRNEPALWCTKCVTSFAQAEIEDVHQGGQYVHLAFPLAENSQESITIATTRPELLSACVCVFVHPHDARFKNFVGKKVRVPLYDHEVPVIADDRAQMDKGTGAVMCCTFGDSTDIYWWRKHQLPLREAIGKFGKMTDLAGPLANLKLEDAKKKVIEILREKNLVLKTVDIPAETRVVNTHERCGTAVEFLTQPQWFIKVCDVKDELIAVGRKIKWHPEFMRSRYENWVENLSWDWAISRQRSFGVPIPAWYSEDGKRVYVPRPEELPVDPLETMPKEPPPSGTWIPDPDVMDTWATSSATPLINAHWTLEDQKENFLPMSMRAQAHDIIRTWAFYTIAKAYFHFGDIPWREIVVSGHVKKPDVQVEGAQIAGQNFQKKTKISKSKDGEKYSPDHLLQTYAADAIRLWSASASLGLDVMFDENGIKDAQKFLNKLWNASRFALMNLEGFSPQASISIVNIEDHWVRAHLKLISRHFDEQMTAYETHRARVELDKFFWTILCDNYIEWTKRRLEKCSAAEAQSAKQTIYDVLLQTLKLYACFAPHITEEIYQIAFRKFENAESIHLLNYSPVEKLSKDEENSLKRESYLLGTINAFRAARSKKGMGFKDSFELVHANDALRDGLQGFENVVLGFASCPHLGILSSASDFEPDMIFDIGEGGKLGLKPSAEALSRLSQKNS